MVSVTAGSDVHHILQKRGAKEIDVGPLDVWEKADMVRQTLAAYRRVLLESPFNNQVNENRMLF